jgi:hypothetical protein
LLVASLFIALEATDRAMILLENSVGARAYVGGSLKVAGYH